MQTNYGWALNKPRIVKGKFLPVINYYFMKAYGEVQF